MSRETEKPFDKHVDEALALVELDVDDTTDETSGEDAVIYQFPDRLKELKIDDASKPVGQIIIDRYKNSEATRTSEEGGEHSRLSRTHALGLLAILGAATTTTKWIPAGAQIAENLLHR